MGVTTTIRDPRLVVLYDADCGICSRFATLLRRLDRHRRLRLAPLQAAERVVDAPSLETLLDAMHVRDRYGRWSIGGAALIRIAEEVALLRPIAVAARVPAIRRSIESIYRWVARNRHRISHLIGEDACTFRPRTHRP